MGSLDMEARKSRFTMSSEIGCPGVGPTGPALAPAPSRLAPVSRRPWTRSQFARIGMRHLTWVTSALGVILIGQANEFSAAYLDNGRVFSPIAFGLCVIALILGLRLFPRPKLGLPLGLLVLALTYTLLVGALVSAPLTSLDAIWSDAGRLVRALLTFVCIFVGMQALLRGGSIGQIASIFTWVAAGVVAYQVASFLVGHQPSIQASVEEDDFRHSGIFGNPNQAASFCVLLICLSLLAPLSAKVKVFIACLAVAGLVSTFSRGGFVCLTCVGVANAIIGSARARTAFLLLACAAAVTVLVVAPILAQSGNLPPAMAKHILGLYELVTGQGDISDNSRGMLVAKALTLIEAHPFAGLGFGRYYKELGIGAHNMYTHLALLAGIPAAMLYTTAIAALGWCGYLLRDQAERRFVLSIAAWMAAMGLSSHNLFDEKYSVLLIATACAIVAARLAPARAREHVMKPRPLPAS
jgi:hypothetical protein